MNKNDINNILVDIRTRKEKLLSEIRYDLEHLRNEHDIAIEINTDINKTRVYDSSKLVKKAEYIKLRDNLTDVNFINQFEESIKSIPVSNGTNYFKKYDVNIGIIADEFLYNSFKDVANFHYVNQENYRELKDVIDVFIVVTAWKGLDNSWKGLGNPNISKIRNDIFNIIEYYKSNGIKTVFYSKEDPTNYNFFVDIAKRCEYIFTTAVEKVDDYKLDCKNENVFVLEFGVNPIYNNPIGIKPEREINGALFAGSWYLKYPHRQVDTRKIFDGVINSSMNLKIIDRNYWLKLERHFYPIEYLKYISPSLDHETLQKLIKLFPWTINLNSIKYSETMFANRVYELQAMGSAILSNYSLGINYTFPNIFMIHEANDATHILDSLSPDELYAHQMFGLRKVLSKHTTFHRISKLLNSIGLNVENIKEKNVAVLVDRKSENIINMYDSQTYPHKEIYTIEEFNENLYKSFDYITFLNENYFYAEFYLEDMINGFKFTNSDFITKDSYYSGDKKVSGIENDYIAEIKDKFKTIFDTTKFDYNDLLNYNALTQKYNGYSIDSLEINTNLDIKNNKKLSKEHKFKYSVIVPVYNNGDLLYGKCFMSLRRIPDFENIEIIFIDDGSTDGYTNILVDRLTRMYPNIKSFKYEKGGSGSASRPRNKGIELVTTDYVTYLDPDNELINNGFEKLYQNLISSDNDLVIGNIVKIDTKESYFNYYEDVKRLFDNRSKFSNKEIKEFLYRTYFKAQSIQALMVKKSLIVENNLNMVEGAIGQDTLFYHQLIYNAKKFEIINENIHVYYSGVKNSTVNTVDINFFKKYLLLEREKYEFLKETDLLKIYLDVRFNYYFKNWYLKKLRHMPENDRQEAIDILKEILSMYNKHFSKKNVDREIKRTLTTKGKFLKKIFN